MIRHLDTNIVIAFLNGQGDISARVREEIGDLCISTFVVAELTYGAEKSQRRQSNLDRIQKLVEAIEVVSFDAECASWYGRIRAELERVGKPTSTMDLLIACVALAHGATLVTHNIAHFQHIPGLIVEDWLA